MNKPYAEVVFYGRLYRIERRTVSELALAVSVQISQLIAQIVLSLVLFGVCLGILLAHVTSKSMYGHIQAFMAWYPLLALATNACRDTLLVWRWQQRKRFVQAFLPQVPQRQEA